MRVLFLLFFLGLALMIGFHHREGFAPLPRLKHRIAVIAHRGGRALAPENTLAALRNAIRLGADYVEVDVRATRDGRLVIMHDRTVDRTTNGSGAVKDLDFATIRALDAGIKFDPRYAGEKVPTLDEVLELCRGKINVYLDHKEAPTAQILEALRRHSMQRHVVIYNDVEDLQEWKRLAPDLPVMPSLPDSYRRAGGIAEFERTLPAEALDGNLEEWTPELIAQAHAAGVKVYVDNLGSNDNPDGFRKALAMDVDGIQTDYPNQLLATLKGRQSVENQQTDRSGRAFIGISDFTAFERAAGTGVSDVALISPKIPTGMPANEVIVSWNADAPEGTGLKIEARAFGDDGHETKFYTLGLWSRTGSPYPRESVNGQKDADGDVQTDTLILRHPAQAVQVRVTLQGADSGRILPRLKFLGISLTDTRADPGQREPDRRVWGKEIVVPQRSQLGWPKGSGWCSPTSTAMVLAFWAKILDRPELDIPVPDAAAAIYDRVYNGTGNWPFNTAFAGEFPGLRAYVTRFADVRELEEWVAADIPPIVSVSYDLLKGKPKDEDPGHLMVCDGFTNDGDIVLNDPATHLDRGESGRKVFPREQFIRAWHRSYNTVYLIYPDDHSVNDPGIRLLTASAGVSGP
ncbi:MAG TPA: glycerophosphodiester phosphodiesterase family protein [Chthonomonadaceae bacterium]|nr:glycerophosphodiester phosphodiesterase family protein [Chthonomonadaceae bacterium]